METPTPQPAVYIAPQQGMGCFAKGCLIVVVVGVLALAAIGGGAWYIYGKAVRAFTSEESINVQIDPPDDAQYAAAAQKLDQLNQAVAANQSSTVEFTAADLNALIARHPSFEDLRGKGRVSIEDNEVTLEMSVPLRKVPLPKLKKRWFNGTARFGVVYDDDEFTFAPKALEANGKSMPSDVLSEMARSFNDGINRGFDEAHKEEPKDAAFWNQIKRIVVEDGKVIVTTKGREPV